MRALVIVVMLVMLAGCRNSDDLGYEVVRVPATAYGPFDAAVAAGPASDAGTSEVHARPAPSCVDPDKPPKHPSDAPFDNCEAMVGRRALDVRATARVRRTHPGACCYAPEVHKVIRIDVE